MGHYRGKRNAARQKFWPGSNAAAIREMKREGGLNLEQQANLLIHGYPNVIESVEMPEVVNPYGTSQRPKVSPYTYQAPTSTHYYQRKEKPKCEQCGRERSAFGAKLCRECWRGNAHKKFQEISSYIEHFLGMPVGKGEFDPFSWMHLDAVQPDFAPELIEEIAKEEFRQGKPFVFCEAPEERERRKLSHGWGDAAIRMTPTRELPERIKQGRKMRNWLRGAQAGYREFVPQTNPKPAVPVVYRRSKLHGRNPARIGSDLSRRRESREVAHQLAA